MTLVSCKYRQKETISRTGRASAETIYDSAMRSSLRGGRLSSRRRVDVFFLKSLLRAGGPANFDASIIIIFRYSRPQSARLFDL